MADLTWSLDSLFFGYCEAPLINDLTATFNPGLVHGIIGPNGSGKSTLLSLMSGQHAPLTGSVNINGCSLISLSSMQSAQQIATVPQEFSFNFPFSVRDCVLMGRHPHIPRFSRPTGNDFNAVDKALETMDLTQLADRPLSELSGGEKQRTVFARALAQDTPGLLLDEPTSSMDIRHALAAMTELKRLAQHENRTVVTVLHDLNMAAAHCDRILVLNKGRIHASGTPDETLTTDTIRTVFGVKAQVMQRQSANGLTIIFD